VRLELSAGLWGSMFAVTSLFFLVQTDAERITVGRNLLLAPWLHSSALPVFAVLSVLAALIYGAATRWLAEYESYAREVVAHARSLASAAALVLPRRSRASLTPPRRRFGLAFECRPPPAPA
jgi:predicted anti-sigma-YlaC factor YlaD